MKLKFEVINLVFAKAIIGTKRTYLTCGVLGGIYRVIYTVRDTENLHFSADTLRRFSEDTMQYTDAHADL